MRDRTRDIIRALVLCVLILIIAFILFPTVCHAEEYTYNDDGQVTQVTHDDGSVTVYEYDKNGNLNHFSCTESSIGIGWKKHGRGGEGSGG